MTAPQEKNKGILPEGMGLGSELLSPVTRQTPSSHGLCLLFQAHRTWIGREINAKEKFSRGSFLINMNLYSGGLWDAQTIAFLVFRSQSHVPASAFCAALSSHQKGCYRMTWSLFIFKRLRLMLSNPASSGASAVVVLNPPKLKLSNRKQ